MNLQHDGALALGSDATIIAADEMALRLLGVDHRQNLIGRRIDEVFDVRAEALAGTPDSGHLWSIRDAVAGRRYFASMSRAPASSATGAPLIRDKPAAGRQAVDAAAQGALLAG